MTRLDRLQLTRAPSAVGDKAAHGRRASFIGSVVVHTLLLGSLLWMQAAKRPTEAAASAGFEMVFEQSFQQADQPPPTLSAIEPPAPAETSAASLPDRPAPALLDPAPVIQVPDAAVPMAPSVAPAPNPAPPAVQEHTPGRTKSARLTLALRPGPKTAIPAMAQPATPDQRPPIATGTSPFQAAPVSQSAASAAPVAVIDPAWHRALSVWMVDHKRYPEAARRRGEAGTVGVTFIVSRNGLVQSVAVTSSSGSAILDEAASSLLDGNHVPQFPAAMQQPQVKVSVRVVYTLDQ